MTFNLSNCVPSLIYGDLVKRQKAIVCTFLLWYCHKEEKVTSITREENLKVWLARSYLRLSVASSSMSFPIIVNRFTGWGFWEVLHYLQFMHHKLLRRLHLSHIVLKMFANGEIKILELCIASLLGCIYQDSQAQSLAGFSCAVSHDFCKRIIPWIKLSYFSYSLHFWYFTCIFSQSHHQLQLFPTLSNWLIPL